MPQIVRLFFYFWPFTTIGSLSISWFCQVTLGFKNTKKFRHFCLIGKISPNGQISIKKSSHPVTLTPACISYPSLTCLSGVGDVHRLRHLWQRNGSAHSPRTEPQKRVQRAPDRSLLLWHSLPDIQHHIVGRGTRDQRYFFASTVFFSIRNTLL